MTNMNEEDRLRWGGPSPWAGRDSRTDAQKRDDIANPLIITYVEYLHPGIFLPETSVHPVTRRDPEHAAREAPRTAYAFRFFDRASVTVTIDGADSVLTGEPVRYSGHYYINATTLTAEDVAALPGDHAILLANMRGNDWLLVVRCRTGNFQPLLPGDCVISPPEGRQGK